MAARRLKPKKAARARPQAARLRTNENWLSQWPQERDLMLRPERIRYVRRTIRIEGCVFCTALQSGANADSLCVYRNEHAMAILNKFPYNTGHIMILPVRHCGDINELSETEYLEVQKLVKTTVGIIKTEYGVDGLNIGLNMGKVAGAGLPDHLHWHIIPRWAGDTNFFPLIAETKVVPEGLEQTYARYARHFAKLGTD
jgi:ATP adenylyltransferase